MGHQRFLKPPALRSLPEIVRYLVTGGTPTEDLVDQVTEAGRDALKRAVRDPVFIKALWLLIRLPQAAATNDYPDNLRDLGMAAVAPTSLSEVLVRYDQALEREQRRLHAGATDLGEMARCAGLSALGDAIRGALPSLWDPTEADVRTTLAALRGPERFGSLAQQYHANFVTRVIHYYLDRNLDKIVGHGRVARSVHDLRAYNEAIRRHCDEAALIMRAFAKDWLGKNHYKEGREISTDDVRNFCFIAAKKIRTELDIRKRAP